MTSRSRTLIARCEPEVDDFVQEYADANGFSSKSDAIRDIINTVMEIEKSQRLGVHKITIEVDNPTYVQMKRILDQGGALTPSQIFAQGFELWQKNLLMKNELNGRVIALLNENNDLAYSTDEKGERGGSAKNF